MNSESVDLIATDPPFNKGRDFHATPDSLAAGAKFQDRWSWERDVHEEWTDQITDDYPRLMEAIESARHAHSDGMGAYMCFMAVRLLAMRRILKPTGSIYLHCDPTASHYLKAVMDAIFGYKNFRNQIIWRRSGSHNDSRRYGCVHDVLLYYVKEQKWAWNGAWMPHDPDYIEQAYRHEDQRGRYRTAPLHTGGLQGGGYEYEFLGYVRTWRYPAERMAEMEREGLIRQSKGGTGIPERKVYLNDSKGRPVPDLWGDVKALTGQNAERVGYPTQKPLAVYERMIKASSNPGDIVLDPFAGCATTLVAAEQLDRQWVGMDIWEGAHKLVRQRLEDATGFFGDVTFTDQPPERTDGGDVAVEAFATPERRSIPKEPWQRMSRKAMFAALARAQSITPGLCLCAGCGRELEAPFMELDHIMPRSGGGPNDISNRILLCRPCNGRKNANLTLPGLLKENNKVGWMQDEKRAIHAQELRQACYEDIRYG